MFCVILCRQDKNRGKFVKNLSGDLRVETVRKHLLCGKMLSTALAGTPFRHFVQTIPGNELEKLPKDATVMRCRVSCVQLEDADTFSAAQNPALTIRSGKGLPGRSGAVQTRQSRRIAGGKQPETGVSGQFNGKGRSI